MYIPEEFVERLEREFGQKYRIRWSDARNEYHIEQKVRRGLAEGFANVNPKNRRQWRARHDDLVRVRDGYVLTMAVKPGNFTHCSECNSKIPVPSYDTAVIQCEFCKMKGRARYEIAGYFPINDALLYHLKKIDAHSGGTERVREAVDRGNRMLEREQSGNLRRPIEAAVRERFNRLVGIPQFGYAGRPYQWIKEQK